VILSNPPAFENQVSNPESSVETDFQALQTTLLRYQIELPEQQVRQLAAYCRLLWDWNTRINLTRHTDWELFVTRDLLDTLQLEKHIPQAAALMDIGSGGGVPGIPLAILRPDLTICLCDSVGKKATVLKDIVTALKLPIPIHAERAEVVLRRHKFQLVTARAVASIDKLMSWLKPVWLSVGHVLLIKGPRWTEELAEARAEGLNKKFEVSEIAAWNTPGRDSQSVLLKIAKSNSAS
jgi:16S rRNA (guanine527-N7)-methyltransferase